MGDTENAGNEEKLGDSGKPHLLKIREVAAILHYTTRWTEEAVLDGRIKSTKIGGQHRITMEEVERVKKDGILPQKSKKKAQPAAQGAAETPKPQPEKPPEPTPPPPAAPAAAKLITPAPAPAEAKKEPPKQPEAPKKESWSIFGAFK